MSNTKKIALMSTLVLLLAVTAIFNFVLAGTRTATADVGKTDVNYFTTYRANRTATRNEEFVQLDSIISAYATDSAEYREAVEEKQKMVSIMEDELVMESIIRTLGFSDVAVSIGNSSDNINVFVNTNELSEDNITKIFYAFEVEHQIREGNIIIMPVYAES